MEHPLVWVDLEMTGLDPATELIVEIAVVVTDGQLEEVVEGPDVVVHAPEDALERMVEVVRTMHRDSGLLDEVRTTDVTVAEAEEAVLAFVLQHVPRAGEAPLAGNSVHADRAFLARFMPRFERHLHYRNVDVSTVKELARRWRPDIVASAPAKAGGHRALADIRESIAELRHYRTTLFGVG